MSSPFLQSKLDQIENAVKRTVETFNGLSAAQLNYKTDPKSWSIAQCLDHLVVTDNQYRNTINELSAGTYEGNIWTKMGILAGFFGSYLIKVTGPIPDKKGKTLPNFEPAQSDLPGNILDTYQAHDKEWRALLSKLDKVDYKKTRISSPAGKAITYSVEDLLTLLANHKERHYHQAVAVMNSAGFPK